MDDNRLEKLGRYFIHFAIQERYGITFEKFVEMVQDGRWQDNMMYREGSTENVFYVTK